jgi:hypothetical protein
MIGAYAMSTLARGEGIRRVAGDAREDHAETSGVRAPGGMITTHEKIRRLRALRLSRELVEAARRAAEK